MTKARARLALFAVLACTAVGAGAPSQANAFLSYYNCTSKPSGQWCDGRANGSFDGLHSWDYNEAWYPGTWDGSVWVCQHVWKPSTGNELAGASCNANTVAHWYGNVQCACYEAEVAQWSSGPKNVNGEADAVF